MFRVTGREIEKVERREGQKRGGGRDVIVCGEVFRRDGVVVCKMNGKREGRFISAILRYLNTLIARDYIQIVPVQITTL